MYQHLSEEANKAIKAANGIAHQYEQEYVGTEHVLLAIAEGAGGLGVKILKNHGLNYDMIKDQVDQLIKASMEDTWVFGRLPGTPHYRNVLARAIEEAGKLNSKEVCTEHILLALLAEKGSVAQKTLAALGLSLGKVREEIRGIYKPIH